MNQHLKGIIYLIISAAGFGMMGILGNLSYQGGFNVSTLVTIRFLLGALVIWVLVIVSKIEIKFNLREFASFAILGCCGYALMGTLFFSSLKYIPTSIATLVLYTYPILVVVLMRVFTNEKFTSMKLLSLAFSFLGLILVVGNLDFTSDQRGLTMAMGAALVYAIYIVLSDRLLKNVSPFVSSAFICTFAGFILLVIGLINRDVNFHYGLQAWVPAALLALFSTALGIAYFLKGLEIVGPSKASIISTLEPVVAIFLSYVLFSETLSVMQLFGVLLVLSSVIFASLKNI